jgi:hypothetical protein
MALKPCVDIVTLNSLKCDEAGATNAWSAIKPSSKIKTKFRNHKPTTPMKKHILSVLIAAAGITAASATAPTWSTGDIIIGFESVSLNKNLLIDIGQGSSVASFSSINAGADLVSTFGSGWYALSDLNWGAFGVPSAKNQLWATVASGNAALTAKSVGALASPLNKYNTMGANYNTDLNFPNANGSGAGLTVGVYMNVGQGTDIGVATWTGNNPSTTPFGAYSVSIENGITGNLDLYQIPNSGSATAIFSQANGNALNVSSAGVVSVVPEPSTYALCGVGALLLFVAYRRKISA